MFVGSYCDTWEGRCGVCAEHGGNWASALGFRQEVKGGGIKGTTLKSLNLSRAQ